MSVGSMGAGGVGAGGMSVGGMGGSCLGGGMGSSGVAASSGPGRLPTPPGGSNSTDLAALGTLPLHAFAAGGVLNYSSRNASLQSDSLQAQLDALEASLLSTSGGDGPGADSASSTGGVGAQLPLGAGGGSACAPHSGSASPIDSANGGRQSDGDGNAGGSGSGGSQHSQEGLSSMGLTHGNSDLHGDDALNLFSSSFTVEGDGVSPMQSSASDGGGTSQAHVEQQSASAGLRLPPYPVQGSRSNPGSQSGNSNDDGQAASASEACAIAVSCRDSDERNVPEDTLADAQPEAETATGAGSPMPAE